MARSNRVIRHPDFKLAAVERMLGSPNISALAEELGVGRYLLYRWLEAYQRGGPEALRGPGPRSARDGLSQKERAGVSETKGRIVELERKIGQQQLELDFFQRALRQVEALEQRSAGRGKRRSTESSK